MARRVVEAAGVVALRDVALRGVALCGAGSSVQVLMVHRPKYDDWTLPKGHVERGESLLETAQREFREETGYQARVVAPVATVDYRVKDTIKRVHWYLGELTADLQEEVKNPKEVAEVAWVDLEEAPSKLTYINEREVLQKASSMRRERNKG